MKSFDKFPPRSAEAFFFFFTLVTVPRSSLSVKLGDTREFMSLKYEPASAEARDTLSDIMGLQSSMIPPVFRGWGGLN